MQIELSYDLVINQEYTDQTAQKCILVISRFSQDMPLIIPSSLTFSYIKHDVKLDRFHLSKLLDTCIIKITATLPYKTKSKSDRNMAEITI